MTQETPTFTMLVRAAYQLSAADARLRGRATREAGALSMTHARILKLLDERGSLSVTELAEGTETSSGAVTQLLKGLVAAGYVEKHVADDDRRRVEVTLTSVGQERSRQREAMIHAWLQTSLASYSEQELTAVVTILTQLGELYDRL